MYIVEKKARSGVFKPSAPFYDIEGWDCTTPRVAVYDSLEGAFSGMEEGGELLKWVHRDGDKYQVYEFDLDDLGLSPEDVLTKEDLMEQERCADAAALGEHWVLKEFRVPPTAKVTTVLLRDWEEKSFLTSNWKNTSPCLGTTLPSEKEFVATRLCNLQYEVCT